MWKLLVALFCLAPLAASAAPLSGRDKAALAGEWRAGDCADKGAASFTLEFAVTGGQIFLNVPGAARLMLTVPATDGDRDALTLSFQDRTSWSFRRGAGGVLVSENPPASLAGLAGTSFRRCRPAADRSALKIAQDAIRFFSVTMPPDHPTFIDASEKDGCRARGYRYISIDLVGPEEFALTRGTLLPAAGDKPPRVADTSTWSIDAAEELPNVVRLTVTPLKGPQRTRGTPEKISLVAGEDAALLTIPEWDAVYRRCAVRDLVGN
ncbi:MAG TPA: hypothetical protein VMH86_04910 [Rhizomicrobium sp.]|nr:hypothetical protein [Rhizomicrobium sp.]